MSTITVNISRGADVMRGSRVVAHFDGDNAVAQAWAYITGRRTLYVRYWAA